MRLVGLHARAQAGKDTAFDIIDRYCVDNDVLAIRSAFADALKISALRALGFNYNFDNETLLFLADEIKKTGRLTLTWDSSGPPQHLNVKAITGREFWQHYGTEAHRADDIGTSFHQDFWVDNLLPLGEVPVKHIGFDEEIEDRTRPLWWDNFKQDWAGFADIAVVTDVRFENEAQRILDLGGEIWRIDSDTRQGENNSEHSSEQPLDPKFITRTIDNNRTIDEFEHDVVLAVIEGWADSVDY